MPYHGAAAIDGASREGSGLVTLEERRAMQPHIITMGMDAFRLAIGLKPKTWPADRIVEWIAMMAERAKRGVM